MTIAAEETDARPAGEAAAPVRPLSRLLGWLPAVLLAAITAVGLRVYDVPLPATGLFALYIGVGVILPGTLAWRALRGRAGWFVGDIAAGAAFGYALETLAYIAARAAGAPLLVLLFPVVTIGAFLAVPTLRRHWRGSCDPADRTPWWLAWTFSGILAVLLFRATRGFQSHLVMWPYNGVYDPDPSFHLAIIGDAKHHMPPVTPWVAGEPMLYHWFVYAEMAATSWVTGIQPVVLLNRLSLLPMIAAFLVLIGAIARSLTGRWWAAALAPAATFFALSPNPYSWRLQDSWFGFSAFDDGSVFTMVTWTSPTQTFGITIFAAAMLLLLELLRADRPWRAELPRWVLLATLLATLTGAKATLLPMLLAALLGVIVVRLLVARRLDRPAAIAAGMAGLGFVFAQLVLYRGANLGLSLDPLAALRMFSAAAASNTGYSTTDSPLRRVALIAAITLVCWLLMWGGIIVLARRRRFLEPGVSLLLSLGAVGLAMFLLLGHIGGAQGYFISSARPYLTIAVVVGLAHVLDERLTRRAGLALLGSAAIGVLAIYVIRLKGGPYIPRANQGYRHVAWALVWPYGVLVAGFLLAGAALVVAVRRGLLTRKLAVGLLVVLGLGTSLPSVGDELRLMVDAGRTQGWRRPPDRAYLYPNDMTGAGAMFPRDAVTVALWLRDHSDPDALVATNVHCLWDPDPKPGNPCDNRHFGLTAISERRMLVEGWGYVSSAYREADKAGVPLWFAPFWDQQLLADNDAAFSAPTADTVGRLRDRYGVTWLFVDEARGSVGTDLPKFATLRFRSGTAAVYEINR
ncbi:hypothetical protein AB0K00_22205 [Dactylosporangium sp. NPDC049525]|uniref:hypothetical protein n=1 Tax=Dactylosporangium sp. NPDC049525 TaxID=3154730 RepID=UPI003419EE62